MPPEKRPVRHIVPNVSHYYGDAVRVLMLCGAGLLLISQPLTNTPPSDEFPGAIAAALVVVAFAALTNPLKAWITAADAFVSGLIAIYFEMSSYPLYTDNLVGFVIDQAIAILFLFAFYFSIKTYRAMLLHQIGKPDSLVELQRTGGGEEEAESNPLEAEETFDIPSKFG